MNPRSAIGKTGSAPAACRTLARCALIFLALGAAHAAEPPIGQVFSVEGAVVVRADTASLPAARGRLLRASDRIELPPGASLGVYFREGGRRLLRAGTTALRGRITEFVPGLEPYRGEAVYFGATRAPSAEGETLLSPAPREQLINFPGGDLILNRPPVFHLEITGNASALASVQMRILSPDSELFRIESSLDTNGGSLRLFAPMLVPGTAGTLEIRLIPNPYNLAAGAESFTHKIPFYLVLESDTGLPDGFISTRYTTMGTLNLPLGPEPVRADYELELAEAAPEPVVSILLAFP